MNMKTKVMSTILAAFMLTMTACGTISSPIQNAVTETTMVSTDSLADSSVLSESDSNTNEEQIRTNTFIAEIFDSGISFADTSKLVTEVMKGCNFESETDSSNGIQKISLKG